MLPALVRAGAHRVVAPMARRGITFIPPDMPKPLPQVQRKAHILLADFSDDDFLLPEHTWFKALFEKARVRPQLHLRG